MADGDVLQIRSGHQVFDNPTGGGLPSQWTDGGHGDVTAASDGTTHLEDGVAFTETPLTITAVAPAAIQRLLEITDDQDARYFDVTLDADGEGVALHFQLPSNNETARQSVTLDDDDSSADASYNIFAGTGGVFFEAFLDKQDAANSYTQSVIREQPSQTEAAIEVQTSEGPRLFAVLAGGAPLIAQTATPADGDLNAGEVALWFDSTDGAAKLKIKGKSANGTVVTGSVNLT